jgi:dihydroorotate dehydrogenase (NAD+) catalytic subunit
MVNDLSVNLCGIRLRNPVIPASGTFGFGLELAGDLNLNVLGGISSKELPGRHGMAIPRPASPNAKAG